MELKGKTINFLGDSITQGAGASSPDKGYVSVIGKKTGAIVRNYGIGGTRIAKQKNKDELEERGNFCDRMKSMEDADITVMLGGTNDHGHGDAPFGEFSDRTPDTFYGACHTVISYLAEKSAGRPFVVVTPLHKLKEDTKSACGKDLEDYVDAIKEVARYYSVPVLDLYAEYGINPVIDSLRARFMTDGLHPSNEGHELLADKIISYLNKL